MDITTLIPAYKPKYVRELLACLRHQTLPSKRILISDDSPNGEFRQELMSEAHQGLRQRLNIEVIEGPRQGAYANVKHLIRQWNGSSELVHLLFDDDVIYPEFYQRHLVTHASAELSCSISRRWTANETGLPLVVGLPVPPQVAQHPNRLLMLDSDVVFMSTVAKCENWFGEFSNAVLRASSCELLLRPELGGVSYAGIWDLGFFVNASLHGPIGFIQDHLGFFRVGGSGNSADRNGPFMKGAFLGYTALAMGAHRLGRLSREQLLACYRVIGPSLQLDYAGQADMQEFLRILPALAREEPGAEERFILAWTEFQTTHRF